jgi:hypothetical protein
MKGDHESARCVFGDQRREQHERQRQITASQAEHGRDDQPDGNSPSYDATPNGKNNTRHIDGQSRGVDAPLAGDVAQRAADDERASASADDRVSATAPTAWQVAASYVETRQQRRRQPSEQPATRTPGQAITLAIARPANERRPAVQLRQTDQSTRGSTGRARRAPAGTTEPAICEGANSSSGHRDFAASRPARRCAPPTAATRRRRSYRPRTAPAGISATATRFRARYGTPRPRLTPKAARPGGSLPGRVGLVDQCPRDGAA